MFVKCKGMLVELIHEKPKADAGHGLMIAFGIMMFAFGFIAAILASA